jgi:hypothetical protein
VIDIEALGSSFPAEPKIAETASRALVSPVRADFAIPSFSDFHQIYFVFPRRAEKS